MEKKDTENMEMKKPEEQAKPKKKKIISVVRPQNATSKEAKEFTKNQGQKKDRPSRGNGRPEGNRNGNGRSEDRPNRGNGNGGNGEDSGKAHGKDGIALVQRLTAYGGGGGQAGSLAFYQYKYSPGDITAVSYTHLTLPTKLEV